MNERKRGGGREGGDRTELGEVDHLAAKEVVLGGERALGHDLDVDLKEGEERRTRRKRWARALRLSFSPAKMGNSKNWPQTGFLVLLQTSDLW